VDVADAPKWKICWITGATGGIGSELSRRLAGRGVKVAATARSADKLKALADSHANITAFSADVTDAKALKATVEKIESDLGPIDLAIFAAGVYAPFDAENIDLEGFHRTSAVNIDGVANSLAAVLPAMQSRGRGQLGIMGSLFGYCGLPGNGSYGASKAYLINLAQSLELELAPKGIEVTLINPGFVDTPLNASYDRAK
jgi:short-subunit dehydrogenase